jgi:hypothetical protein
MTAPYPAPWWLMHGRGRIFQRYMRAREDDYAMLARRRANPAAFRV